MRSPSLDTDLKKEFEDISTGSFGFYPYSNEFVEASVKELSSKPRADMKGCTPVGIVFGESHFLSLIDALSEHVELLIMADISKDLHEHTQHLQKCFEQANNPNEFKQLYCNEASAFFERRKELHQHLNEQPGFSNLKDLHFLSSKKRYEECKAALKKIKIARINFNLLNPFHAGKLRYFLHKNNAILSLINVTNIGYYENSCWTKPARGALLESLHLLIPREIKDNVIVLHARGPNIALSMSMTQGFDIYLNLLRDGIFHLTDNAYGVYNRYLKRKYERVIAVVNNFFSEIAPAHPRPEIEIKSDYRIQMTLYVDWVLKKNPSDFPEVTKIISSLQVAYLGIGRTVTEKELISLYKLAVVHNTAKNPEITQSRHVLFAKRAFQHWKGLIKKEKPLKKLKY